ncbi:MAG: HAMP domain-containing histidine kinase [Myxococcales bacterium]|nr:HAMP domain-containing histidine kinase [Myxococcales bacterium]MCB9751747.1 HAMP domain-containing histidine kinase [Myxococcales bacterium]
MGRFFLGRLHRRIFAWFSASILVSALTAATLVWALASADHPTWREQIERGEAFIGSRYAEVWTQPDARDALTRELAENFAVAVTVRDEGGRVLTRAGEVCARPDLRASVEREGARVGEAAVCMRHGHVRGGGVLLLALLSAVSILWLASAVIAYRLARPFAQLVRVTRAIGEGRLGSRIQLNRRAPGEVGLLAETVNDMAARIEKQLADQRELLAAVSHELRTPLGHMRVLLEIGRDADEVGVNAGCFDELEREVLELDGLVDQLLASSRIEFDSLDRRALEPTALARRALERASLPASLLSYGTDTETSADAPQGDATLLLRALANLLQNARAHGGGVTGVRVREDAARVSFEVEDAGPGFADAERGRVFSSFYRGDHRAGARHGSIGLGLSLVRRIAEAHGGEAWAENRPEGGARVGFSIARASEEVEKDM